MSTISVLPTPPSRLEPATFSIRTDAFLAALPTFVTETNAVSEEVSLAVTASANYVSVTNSQVYLATAAAEVVSSASAVASASVWVSGTTYSIGNCRYSPSNYLVYRRITAGTGTADPSTDPTNWRLATASVHPLFTASGDITVGSVVGLNYDGTVSNLGYIPTGFSTEVNVNASTRQGIECLAMSELSSGLLPYFIVSYHAQDYNKIHSVLGVIGTDRVVSFYTPTTIVFGVPFTYMSMCSLPHLNCVAFAYVYFSTLTVKSLSLNINGDISGAGPWSAGGNADSIVPIKVIATGDHSIVIVYSTGGVTQKTFAVVGTFTSSTSFTCGTPVEIASSPKRVIDAAYDSVLNKVVVVYGDGFDYGYARVGTVSGDSISFQTQVVLNSGAVSNVAIAYDPISGKMAIAFALNGGSSVYGIVGTVATTITFGTAVAFSGAKNTFSLNYNSNARTMDLFCLNASNYICVVPFTVVNETIIFGTEYTSTRANYGSMLDTKYHSLMGVCLYTGITDGINSPVACTFKHATPSVGDVIGIAQNTALTGKPVYVATSGMIDTHQSGLYSGVSYYLTPTGTLSNVPVGNVLFGKGVSSTSLFITYKYT